MTLYFRLALLSLIAMQGATSAMALEYSNRIPRWQVRALEKDLSRLDRMKLDQGDSPRLYRMFGLEGSPTGALLHDWLNERVKVMVSEDWDPGREISATPAHFTDLEMPPVYAEPRAAEHPEKSDSGTWVVFMENVGSEIYRLLKSQHSYGTFLLDGKRMIEIKSPRDGILKMGAGLFNRGATLHPEAPDAEANSIYRLAILIHEGRHSDGHGLSLTFNHAFCPDGHSYQGLLACDANRNGPYTYGGEALRWMTENCENCTTGEKEALRVAALDSFSRVLPTFEEVLDFNSENQLRTEVSDCQNSQRVAMEALTGKCTEKYQRLNLLKNGKISHATEYLDSAPEAATSR